MKNLYTLIITLLAMRGDLSYENYILGCSGSIWSILGSLNVWGAYQNGAGDCRGEGTLTVKVNPGAELIIRLGFIFKPHEGFKDLSIIWKNVITSEGEVFTSEMVEELSRAAIHAVNGILSKITEFDHFDKEEVSEL